MIKKLLTSRYFQIGVITVLLFAALSVRLAYLTVEHGQAYHAMAQEKKRIELTLRGNRGNILDRNGIPLAVNRQIYVAQVDRQWLPASHNEINAVLEELIVTLEENGERLEYNLPIQFGMRVYDDVVPPYAVDDLFYDFKTQFPDRHRTLYNRWRSDAEIPKDLPADEMLAHLRQRYQISSDLDDTIAAKIISIRLDLFMSRFRQHEPVIVAETLNPRTVARLTTRADTMPGVQVVVAAGRYYPQGQSAQHIIGYVGRLTDNNIVNHKARHGTTPTEDGYNIFLDKYGQDGVEAYAEPWLTGNITERHGELIAEVDAHRRVVQLLRETPPQNGYDVVLTLDSRLQRAAERILEEEVHKIRSGIPPYDGDRQGPLAESGAIVMMDANTGEMLAMATYSDSEYAYDLNQFARGISRQDYANLLNDPTNPLFSLAFQGGLEPGSIFKMLVGLGAMEEGKLSPRETIFDRIQYLQGPRCWSRYGHGSLNVADALKVSCNYFFTVIGYRMGIDSILQWGINLGLHGHPGLEILPRDPNNPLRNSNLVAHPDMRAYINSPEFKAANIRGRLRNVYGVEVSADESLELARVRPSDGTFEDGVRQAEQLTVMLLRMGYFDDQRVLRQVVGDIRDILRVAVTWSAGFDTLHASIGQSDSKTSPLGIARFIATIANGGRVLDTRVIREIRDDSGGRIELFEPVVQEIELNPTYLETIRDGMHRVIYAPGGTAVRSFRGIDPAITLAGKTGTAQRIPTDANHNTGWFTAYTPYENPEVVLVVMLPKSRSSGNAAVVGRIMLEEYYRIKAVDQQNPLPAFNQLAQ